MSTPRFLICAGDAVDRLFPSVEIALHRIAQRRRVPPVPMRAPRDVALHAAIDADQHDARGAELDGQVDCLKPELPPAPRLAGFSSSSLSLLGLCTWVRWIPYSWQARASCDSRRPGQSFMPLCNCHHMKSQE